MNSKVPMSYCKTTVAGICFQSANVCKAYPNMPVDNESACEKNKRNKCDGSVAEAFVKETRIQVNVSGRFELVYPLNFVKIKTCL